MSCNVGFKELSLYLDGRYAGSKKQAIDKHILECSRCKEQLDSMRSLKESLNSLTPVKESEGFDFEFNRRLKERLNRPKVPVWKIKAGLAGSLAWVKENIIYPVPVAARVAACFFLVMAVAAGVRTQALRRYPVVEFIAGNVKIYRTTGEGGIAPGVNMRLKPGDKIQSKKGAVFNIASKDRYKARIKDDSLIIVSKLQSGWRNIDTGLDISYGTLLVNTTEEFKGSKMQIHTPACDAEVVGTAFMIRVIPEDESMTWLGVLEGKVKVISRPHPLERKQLGEAVAYVSSGQKTTIGLYSYPTVPELFSEKEWRSMQELYQLSERCQIILLIGTEADRIEELLKPAPVYIPDTRPRAVPGQIRNMVEAVITAMKQGNHDLLNKSVKELEGLLERYPDPEYDVEILMFIASHYHYLKDYQGAMRIFERVIKTYPDSELASLAQCAIATIYQQDLKDIRRAEQAYQSLLVGYPDSIDAARAKEFLAK